MTDDQFLSLTLQLSTIIGVLYGIRNLLGTLIIAAGFFVGLWSWDFWVRMFSYGNFLTRE